MYIQDSAFPQNARFTAFDAAVPELFFNDQYDQPRQTAPKKRKRSDEDDGANIRIISKPEYQLDFLSSPFTNNNHNNNNLQSVALLQPQNVIPQIYLHAPAATVPTKRQKSNRKGSLPPSPQRSNPAPPQLQVITDLPSPSTARRISSPAISPKTIPVSLLMLKACHICHRRPFTRSHLDSYINCDICAERTCYICMRECGGSTCPGRIQEEPSGSARSAGRKVCSVCAVEGGVDGELVRCRECVQQSQVHDPADANHGGGWIEGAPSGNLSSGSANQFND